MIQPRLIILLILISISSFGQQHNFDLEKIKFKGLGIKASKKEITEKFGQGKRLETNYECGFFTNDLPGGPYYQLVYSDFTFIGSDKEEFYLESVDFDASGKTGIQYGDKALNGKTTKEEFIKIFGEVAKRHFDNADTDAIVLIGNSRGDGARFAFKNGRLVKFEYWTPC